MKKLDEISINAKQLYEDLKDLEQSSKKEKLNDIDFNYFRGAAKHNAFNEHILKNENEYIQRNYLYLISSLLMFNNKEEVKNSQFLYIARLVAGFSNKNLDIENIYANTMIMDGKQISDCIEAIKEYKDVFVVDSLICANIEGKANDEVLEYLSEIYFMMGMNSNKLKELIKLCNCILENNKEEILFSNIEDLNLFKHHLKYIIREKIFYDFSKLSMEDKNEIIILNSVIDLKEINKLSDIEIKNDLIYISEFEKLGLKEKVINLDKYCCKNIRFINCKFDGIISIISKNKEVIFNDCNFENLRDYMLKNSWGRYIAPIDLKNCKMINCNFKNCNTTQEVLHIIDSSLENIKFKDCKNRDLLVLAETSKIKNLNVLNCNMTGEYPSDPGKILSLNNSYMEDADFSIIFADHSYGVVELINSTMKNISLKNIDINAGSSHRGIVYAEKSKLIDTILNNCNIGLERTYTNSNLIFLKDSKSINHKFIDCKYTGYGVREDD